MKDARGRRLTVLADERRYDVVAPPGARVGDLLSSLGIGHASSPLAVATPLGTVLGTREVVVDHVDEGAVLTVVRATTHEVVRGMVNLGPTGQGAGARSPEGQGGRVRPPSEDTIARRQVDEATVRRSALPAGLAPPVPAPTTRAERRERANRRPVGTPGAGAAASVVADVPVLLVLAVVGLAAAGASTVAASSLVGRPGGPVWSGLVAGGLLLLGALALAVRSTASRPDRAARTVAPFAAFAAGLLLPVPAGPGAGGVAVVGGLALGAVVAGVARVASGRHDGVSRVSMAAFSVLGALGATGVLLEWSPAAVGAVAAGLAPLVVRLLPSLGLDVPDEQLVDVDRLSTTVWSVREQRPARRRRVRREEVSVRFRRARDVVAVGTLWASVVAPAGAALLLLDPSPDAVPRWGAVGLCVLLALAMGYQSRSVRDRLPRFALLASATALVLEVVAALAATTSPGTLIVVVVALAALGLVVLVGAAALVNGWRSPRLSRLADLLESTAVVLALPVAIVAAGGFEAFRRLTSG